MLGPYLLISINELLISIISFNDINKYGLNVKTAAHKLTRREDNLGKMKSQNNNKTTVWIAAFLLARNKDSDSARRKPVLILYLSTDSRTHSDLCLLIDVMIGMQKNRKATRAAARGVYDKALLKNCQR